MNTTKGTVTGVNGNMVAVEIAGPVMQNEVAMIHRDGVVLQSEIVRITGNVAAVQVFEDTRDLRVGDPVDFTGRLLSVQLGPGLLGQIYDGLQNPLPRIAEEAGFFLPPGSMAEGLDGERRWRFTPTVEAGDVVTAGSAIGTVPEGIFDHAIMVPFDLEGDATVLSIAGPGEYAVADPVARIREEGGRERELKLAFYWPVKRPIRAYADRLAPREPLVTGVRIIDTFFPVARGGTFCIPGPFGAGKTVLQHIISRHADVDVVIVAACGERAGEVVELLREFPELEDPRTGRSLMERTIIICNTSSMPVAAREASIYTAATLGEYYRQMGLNVLLLADSTSRWAQAMREASGRLEEIPGEEAFPAYLESRIAEFYERAGRVVLPDGRSGSLTIGGTVSPAGGNFEEPVTQATLKVVGAFLGLSRERANARRFPSIDPLESWSKYPGIIDGERVRLGRTLLARGDSVRQMMMVLGESGISAADFEAFLKSELLDRVYLQQNAFDAVDAATAPDRQERVYAMLCRVLAAELSGEDREATRARFNRLQQLFLDWNYLAMADAAFAEREAEIAEVVGAPPPPA